MATSKYIPKDVSKFWKKVAKTENPDECWLWLAPLDRGYGQFNGGRAHRVSYELAYGEIPEGLCVCHSCDNPACVNPNHLFLGTHNDNVQDKIRKGRGAKGDAVASKGEKHPRHKLTNEQVLYIRQRYAEGGITMRELGRQFGVAHVQIVHIVNGKTWKSV